MQVHPDIPSPAQRQGILNLILNDEKLAPDMSIEKLVKLTSLYTGLDLKNMCVTAATEYVGELEENSQHRVLHFRHFKSAMASFKASGLARPCSTNCEASGTAMGLDSGGQPR
jgi:SpoVK/Ycf46/Vps4 family AAA+-type ATPase